MVEVDALMDMAKVKLNQLCQHGALLDQYGACIRVLGQRELIKPDVLKAVDKAVEMTSQNGNAVLNICFPYTSRDEITTAVRRTVDEWSQPLPERTGVGPFKADRITQNIRNQNKDNRSETGGTYLSAPKSTLSASSSTTSLSSNGDSLNDSRSSLSSSTTLHQSSSPPLLAADLKDPLSTPSSQPTSHSLRQQQQQHPPQPIYHTSPEAITSSTLTSHMFTADNPPLDLLVRTSSVHRLSDFMLWQCHQDTEIAFLDVLWPEFDLWTFLPVLWEWQWRQKKMRSENEDGNRERRLQGRERSDGRIRADRKKTVKQLAGESLD